MDLEIRKFFLPPPCTNLPIKFTQPPLLHGPPPSDVTLYGRTPPKLECPSVKSATFVAVGHSFPPSFLLSFTRKWSKYIASLSSVVLDRLLPLFARIMTLSARTDTT